MIEFWFEFASTYSYPAAMRIERIAEESGIKVSWKTFLLGPIFKSQGWHDSPFNLYEAKGAYMWRDIQRICEENAIAYQRPTQFPRNGLLASRVACWYQDSSWIGKFVREVYAANFGRDLDISREKVVANCIEMAGEDSHEILKCAKSDASKEKLFEQTEQAKRKSIFGAPTLIVNGELFWGNDRLEQALRWHEYPA